MVWTQYELLIKKCWLLYTFFSNHWLLSNLTLTYGATRSKKLNFRPIVHCFDWIIKIRNSSSPLRRLAIHGDYSPIETETTCNPKQQRVSDFVELTKSSVSHSTCEILASTPQVLDLPLGSELRTKKKNLPQASWSFELVHPRVHLSTKDLSPRSNHESLSTNTVFYSKDYLTFCEAPQKSMIKMTVPQIRSSIRRRLFSFMAQILACFWRLSTAEY